ncbi:Dimeric dUTPase, all-alpha-NTP-PPase (MazG) superfamily [Virgibacillus subterraneus]|uniref:Dimeric dUTPase, all-alpha-NTP-PPase (MazG) superfamily n=1 Tax=Virgibacillus subterraneus TaxID=621109 RepID=A0A1H9ECZ9_9BACI|nr:dUTP diphosphatase [Virgibacillus subterraneus]SEQ22868.1 Dimeric dUTPase, all-alpha-NTP-PPase (MazG) superfamily [Virgibacillus subterraneus]
MNLTKLFDIQKVLDNRIIEEHKLQGQELLDKKILALQVELGELANEWRGFKFWKVNKEPRDKNIECHACNGNGGFDHEEYYDPCIYCDATGIQEKNPLLEEYVDGIHFLLSIGLELNYDYTPMPSFFPNNLVTLFTEVNFKAAELYCLIYANRFKKNDKVVLDSYQDLFDEYLIIGQILGFTEEQVLNAYLDKNKINHERQDNAY